MDVVVRRVLITSQIAEIKRFPNVGSLVVYAGLDPTVKELEPPRKRENLVKKA